MVGTIIIYIIILGVMGFITYYFFFRGKVEETNDAIAQEMIENSNMKNKDNYSSDEEE